MTKLAMIGTGYVGLTTGAVMAHLGHQVVCADLDAAKVARLNQGELHIYEPGLRDMVAAGLASGALRFVVGAEEAARDCEVAFMCVQTPSGPDGEADLTWVLDAAVELGRVLPPGAIVVNKSTVPIGGAGRVAEALARPDVPVVSNPEFLREGTALADCLSPDRIVVGAPSAAAAQRIAALYRGIDAPVVLTDVTSAEMIKYASNAYLAVKLSYVNEIATLCERLGADALDVVRGMGYDQRIGSDALKPGPGWGGSCLPKDTAALSHIASVAGAPAGVLRAAMAANTEQRARVVAKVADMVPGGLAGSRVAAWGLTFKANTDDLRDSPALAVIAELLAVGATVVAHDPQVHTPPLPGLLLADDPLHACEGADVLVVLTEWPSFANIDLGDVSSRMAASAIVDTRNLLDRAAVEARGFRYVGIGR